MYTIVYTIVYISGIQMTLSDSVGQSTLTLANLRYPAEHMEAS